MVDEKSAKNQNILRDMDQTLRVMNEIYVWHKSSQKILKISCGVRDECDP